ncbi:hypothetical protein CFP65_4512 [Kitasatospora sp. MMS16-BH015]|uniref:FtsX-like permease family protein n=1 Tax=Kitasatospora sp. MMS16-BH015 TaxID=2018025 RepID=UPI000CA0C0AB|nr:FtsX-like permease family protein [Kitasatospora sp. MMS16-BH015]AUG79259.1 hypothetical protein CFP65_4512 [Kitasatospora sp. MMS16-BH015]
MLSSWGPALRIARRDALRAKGRSALVLAMIALPVLGVTGADIVYRSAQLTPVEQAARQIGGADLFVRSIAPGETVLQAPNSDTEFLSTQAKPLTVEQQRSSTADPAKLIAELLPAGSKFTPVKTGPTVGASSREGLLRTETTEADLTDKAWAGRLDLVDGKAPSAAGQLAATQAFLDQAGLKVGDTTKVQGLESTPFTITGVVEHPGDLRKVELVARPGELLPALDKLNPPVGGPADPTANRPKGGASWLVELPTGAAATADWAKVRELNKYGYTATSHEVALHLPPKSDVPYYANRVSLTDSSDQLTMAVVAVVTVMALLEVVLLAGPAFAVGARRSRRQLGLLAATGGDRSHVRSVVLGSGAVLGAAGAVVGVAAGVLAVAVTRPWAEAIAGARFGHFALEPAELAGIALLGLATGLLAALVPAVQAARQEVTEALRARRSPKPANGRPAVLGALMLAGGAALALYGAVTDSGRGMIVAAGMDRPMLAVAGGSIAAELGVVICTPFLVGQIGRLGRWLPLSPRLALRDAVRHRARTAPAVAAVLAAVAGSVAVGIYTASSDAQARAEYHATMPSGAVSLQLFGDQAKLPGAVAALATAMPGLGERADVGTATYVFCPTCSSYAELQVPAGATPQPGSRLSGFPGVRVGDTTLLHNLFGVRDPAVEAALGSGKTVVFDPAYVKDGKISLKLTGSAGVVQPGQTPKPAVSYVSVDAVVFDRPAAAAFGPVLLSKAAAQGAGLQAQVTGAVWLPAQVPSAKEEQRGAAAAASLGVHSEVRVERGFHPSYDLVPLALTAFSALVALGAAGIATGLAAADSQQDLTTLAAVGATPGIRRRLSGFQAGVIATLGAVLGTVSGFVPAVALRELRNSAMRGLSGEGVHVVVAPVAVPWTELLVILIGVPLAAVLLAGLCTRARLPLARRAE